MHSLPLHSLWVVYGNGITFKINFFVLQNAMAFRRRRGRGSRRRRSFRRYRRGVPLFFFYLQVLDDSGDEGEGDLLPEERRELWRLQQRSRAGTPRSRHQSPIHQQYSTFNSTVYPRAWNPMIESATGYPSSPFASNCCYGTKQMSHRPPDHGFTSSKQWSFSSRTTPEELRHHPYPYPTSSWTHLISTQCTNPTQLETSKSSTNEYSKLTPSGTNTTIERSLSGSETGLQSSTE